MKQDDLMTPIEVAELCKVPVSRIWALSHSGELDVAKVKIGHRTLRFRRSEIEKWINSKGVNTCGSLSVPSRSKD